MLNSDYVEVISDAPLSSYYFDNNLIHSFESLTYWNDYVGLTGAIWGRELLNKIAWVIFGTSCGVMLLFVIFVIAMN